MNRTLMLIIPALFAAGCGGGGRDIDVLSIDANPIRIFPDGSGVAKFRAVSAEGVTTGYILSPELTLVLQELEGSAETTPFDITSLPLVDSGPQTQTRQGAVTVEGVTVNVMAVITNSEDAGLVLLEEPTFGSSMLISEGIEASGVPTSGTATYSGLFGMQDVYFDPEPELGTFNAIANFDSSTVDFDGTTASYRASGTSVISGNSFASGSMTIEDVPFAIITSGSLQGDFHGSDGNSIAGVIHSNDSEATYRGGFVGSK